MEPVRVLRSRTVVLPVDDVDTDQIIPARFLKGTTKTGLGKHLFADWRYDAAGHAKADFVLNRPETVGARVLVAGRNFGCGSSREHAPWALVDFGFRAVVSLSFGDIFRTNALKNGLLPVEVDAATHSALLASSGSEVVVDLEAKALVLADGRRIPFAIEPFARFCLINGTDELDFLLSLDPTIAAYEAARRLHP